MTRIFFLIFTIFFICSCNLTKDNIFAPNKKVFKMMPDGPSDFQRGWMHGCETGLSTGFATDFYRYFYKFQKDIQEVKNGNVSYLRPWSAAMIYCRHYAVGTLKEAKMAPKLPGQNFPPIPFGSETLFGNVFSLKNQGSVGLEHW